MYPSVATKRLALAAALWAAAMPSGCAFKNKSLKPVWNQQDALAVSASPGLAANKTLLESEPSDRQPADANRSDSPGSTSQGSNSLASDKASKSDAGTAAKPASYARSGLAASATSSISIAMSQAPRDPTVDPTEFQDISLESCLRIAMAGSPVVRSLGGRLLDNPAQAHTQFDQEISASDPFFGPQAALAQFDAVLGSSLNATNYDRVFNNVISGGNAQELRENAASSNTSIQKRSMTGAVFDVRSINGYDTNNRIGNLFPSYWETQLEAGVRQPLMRGAGRQFNSIAGPNATPGFNFSQGLVIAQMNNQIAAADFEISLQRFVLEVHQAYWALHQAYQSYENTRQTRELAYRTWQMVTARSSEGIEGGQVDKETLARQKYQRYRRASIAALGGGSSEIGVYEAERRLRHLMGLPLLDSKLLRPSDPIPAAPVTYDWESLVATSMMDRVELRRQAIKVRQQQLKLLASKNFLLPQLDLTGRYRLRGFGDDLTGSGPRFSSAYQDFFSLDHQESEFGIEWGMAAGRRQARAALRNASLQLARERAVLAEQQRELIAKLNETVSRSRSLYNTMEIGREEQTAADERMRANWVLYEIDKVDLFMLLDARENLLQTSEQFNADSVQYALSTVDVAYQSGRLLNDLGISIIGSDLNDDAACVNQTLKESIPKPPAAPMEEIQTLESSEPSGALHEVQPLLAPRPDESTFVIPPSKVTPPESLRLPKPGTGAATTLPSRIGNSRIAASHTANSRIAASPQAAMPAARVTTGSHQPSLPQPMLQMIDDDLEPPANRPTEKTAPTVNGPISTDSSSQPARVISSIPAAGNSQLPKRIGSTAPRSGSL